MIIVSDTGPLNYLALIGHLDLLAKLYGEVIIPGAVAAELSRPQSPEAARMLIDSKPAWLRVQNVLATDPTLAELGDGEQQAIILAQSLNASLLLCDDKTARRVARNRSLKVLGTIGVLREAANRGLIDLSVAFSALRATNFRISKALIQRILKDQ